MSERRRAPRYVLNTPLHGHALPLLFAVVELFWVYHVVVSAPAAPRPDEQLLVHLATPGGLTTHAAQVLSSTPMALGGTVSFRLELQVAARAVPDQEPA
jgi:hypothetical protein